MKAALGLLLVAIGALVLAGVDKSVEAALVNASPQWLTDLTTRF
jgi:cytochrome c-type biogenesis protein